MGKIAGGLFGGPQDRGARSQVLQNVFVKAAALAA